MPESREKTSLDSAHYNIKPYHDAGLVNKAAELIKNHPSDSVLSNNLSSYLQTPRRTKGEIVKQLFEDATPFIIGMGIVAAFILICTSGVMVAGFPLWQLLIVGGVTLGTALYGIFLVVAVVYELGSYLHNLITNPAQERLQQEEKKLETCIQNVTASKEESKNGMKKEVIEGSVDEESNTNQLNLSSKKQSAMHNPHMLFSSSVASESANQESMASEHRVNPSHS